MAPKKLFGFLSPLHTEIGLFVMPYVTLQVEVSIYFIMVLKLFIVAFRECSKIVDLYPLKFLVLVFSLFFSFTGHCTRIGNACSQSPTALSPGEKEISGYEFITSHKTFPLPSILTFVKIRHMLREKALLHEKGQRLYKKETKYKNRHLCHIRILISVHLASYSNENKPLSVLLYPT